MLAAEIIVGITFLIQSVIREIQWNPYRYQLLNYVLSLYAIEIRSDGSLKLKFSSWLFRINGLQFIKALFYSLSQLLAIFFGREGEDEQPGD